MARVREQQLAGLGVETGQERRGEPDPVTVLKKVIVEASDKRRLIPVIDILPQRVVQTDSGGADRFPVTGHVRECYPGDDSVAANRQIIDVAAPRRGAKRMTRDPACQTWQLSGIRR